MHVDLINVALGIACITLGEKTERPVTVAHCSNQLVGFHSTKILAAAMAVINRSQTTERLRPDHWDGTAASRIVECLRNYFQGE